MYVVGSHKSRPCTQALKGWKGMENVKTSQRLGENIHKTYLMKDCYPKYTKNLKIQQ